MILHILFSSYFPHHDERHPLVDALRVVVLLGASIGCQAWNTGMRTKNGTRTKLETGLTDLSVRLSPISRASPGLLRPPGGRGSQACLASGTASGWLLIDAFIVSSLDAAFERA